MDDKMKGGKDMDGKSRVTDLWIFNRGEMLPDGTPIEFGECMACETEIAPAYQGSFGRYPNECPECGRMFVFERWAED